MPPSRTNSHCSMVVPSAPSIMTAPPRCTDQSPGDGTTYGSRSASSSDHNQSENEPTLPQQPFEISRLNGGSQLGAECAKLSPRSVMFLAAPSLPPAGSSAAPRIETSVFSRGAMTARLPPADTSASVALGMRKMVSVAACSHGYCWLSLHGTMQPSCHLEENATQRCQQ